MSQFFETVFGILIAFEQGKVYTLPVPFANKLKGNYVVGITVAYLRIQILEVGYVKP